MTTEPEFQGTIGRSFQDSTPWWPPVPDTADGESPNVVVILFDDLGFSHFGCYGSTIGTPNIDALAEAGVRFTNFHTTALCSPTRASLLTGRNHHSIGMRGIADYDSGFPNMRGAITRNAATLAEMLRDHGYATFATGKWHLAPKEERSAAGPFDAWPLQRGFDHYYGFLSGAEDQFYPDLTEDNHHIHPPKTPDEGYHFSEDVVDHAIGYIRDHRSVYPSRPFFLYLPFGATHSPHQAPKEYIDKYAGKFDNGWDATREEWFARQLESGIVPPGTDLAPRNPGVERWEDLPENARKLAARLQEAFAGFLDHTDAQIGRLVRFLEETGDIDNTILIVTSDNGASQEGGPQGITDEARYSHPYLDDLDTIEERLEEIGGPHSSPNYPWGWAQAGNTPLKWYKSTVHGGGIRDPLVVHWPKGITDRGAIRHEFAHVTDIVPTILELLDLEAPESYRGVSQMPIHGASFAGALLGNAEVDRRAPQYFEMFGHRAIWADGWKATSRHRKNDPYSDDEWQLYHLDEDFLRGPRSRRVRAREAPRDDRPLVGRSRQARRPAARRPELPARRAPTAPGWHPRAPQVPLHPADLAAARAGVARARPRGVDDDHRSGTQRGLGRRSALREGDPEHRDRLLRSGQQAPLRLQRLHGHHVRRVRRRAARRPHDSRSPL